MTLHDKGYRIDDLDRRIIYALMQDGRATATSIAETANVSSDSKTAGSSRGIERRSTSRQPAASSAISTCVTFPPPNERHSPTRRGPFLASSTSEP